MRTTAFFSGILFALICTHGLAQTTLWFEDFTYADGTAQGSGAPPRWTVDVSGASIVPPNDWFHILSNQMDARDTDGEVVWISETVNIYKYRNIHISVDVSQTGDMEGTDYLNVFYSIDGQAESIFDTGGYNSGNFGSLTATQNDLNGSTMAVIIRLKNNAGTEQHHFDNVMIQGTQTPRFNIRQGANIISNNGTYNFGESKVTTPISLTFTIENTGSANLTLNTPLVKDGSHAGDFVLDTQPTSPVAPSGNTTFQVTFTPSAHGTRTAVLTFYHDDLDENPFNMTLTGIGTNNGATISHIPNQVTDEDVVTPPIPFTVTDIDAGSDQHACYGRSQNQALVSDDNIMIDGFHEEKTVTIKPAPNAFGSTMISIYVSDGYENTVETFVLTVNPVNDPPTITDIPDQVILEDCSTGPLTFTIDDIDNDVGDLHCDCTVDLEDIIPLTNIVFSEVTSALPGHENIVNAKDKTMTITPAQDKNGVAHVVVIVTDGGQSTSDTVQVTITSVNDPPRFMGPLPPINLPQRTFYGFPMPLLYPLVHDADNADSTLTWSVENHDHLKPVFGPDSLKFTAPTTWVGTDTLTVFISDGILKDSTELVISITKRVDITQPAPPTGLTATISVSSIKLSWNPNIEPDITAYVIYRSTDSTAFDATKVIGSTVHPTVTFTDNTVTHGVTYYYSVSAVDVATNESINNPVTQGFLNTDIENGQPGPTEFSMMQNFPNPFNPVTTIKYTLPKATHVQIVVSNMAGQLIQTLVDENRNIGYHTIQWDATHVPSGIYVYAIRTKEFTQFRKCILLK